MNNINNIFKQNEINNKLKDFKEGKDYSIMREGRNLIYNFHTGWLREAFGDNYTTVYEVAENWDSDNFNHHREEGKYTNNDKGTEITYTYEHRINKGGDYHVEWSKSWGNRSEGWGFGRVKPNLDNVLTINAKPYQAFGEYNPSSSSNQNFLEEAKLKHKKLVGKLNDLKSRPESEFGANGKEKKDFEITQVKNDIAKIEREIEKEKGNNNCDNKIAGCCNCGFKDIRPSDNYCEKCGAELCDKAKNSNLAQENQELRQQLSKVQKQLAEVLAELKKLKGELSGQNSEKLDQQIIQDEKLIKDNENVSVAEVQEQVKKSETLMKEFNVSVSPTKDNEGNGSLLYVIGGSVILVVTGIIGYCLLKKNRGKKVA